VNYLRSLLPTSVLLALSASAAAAPVAQWELGVVLTRTPDVQQGATVYATCAACHGQKGEGVSDGTVPAIAGQSYTVVAKQIVDFRAGVRSDLRMEHFTNRQHLSFSQPIADVAMYIARLPPPGPKPAPAGADVTHGAMAYARTCARCHGELAEGKEDTLAPRLAGQHYKYILRQLDAAPNGERKTMVRSHAGLQKVLARGEVEAVAAYLTTLGP
jgi:cytochrome c553